jgi:hypothetical protein
MKKAGERLGTDRKRIGDFACHLHQITHNRPHVRADGDAKRDDTGMCQRLVRTAEKPARPRLDRYTSTCGGAAIRCARP